MTESTSPVAPPAAVHVPHELLERVAALYERGLYLQAYALAQSAGPFGRWQGIPARIMAGRLAGNLGAPRLGTALFRLAWRQGPSDPEAIAYYVRTVHGRFGPYPARKLWQRYGEMPDASPSQRADWLSIAADIAAQLRDFEAADDLMARAIALDSDLPWIFVEHSHVLELEDRYPEALQAAQHALERRPWYRPAVQAVAHMLCLMDRDGEALSLLREGADRLESCAVVAQLAALQMELGDYAESRRNWDRVVELMPLADKPTRKWLAANRSDAAYYCDDIAAAADLAMQADNPFHKRIVEELRADRPDARRVLLPVGFVRQHYQTCAPATLSAISRYWKVPAEQLSIVEAICYDGTPNHAERAWAEEQGWAVREFAITWDSAVALLDRGIPFTLTTADPGGGHLQAVIGYDGRRGTFLIRDPYLRHSGECLATAFLEANRSIGPRGMAMAPADRAALLDELNLPDAPLYDLFHEVQISLQKHDRARAVDSAARLDAAAPGHRLALWARRAIAGYDGDPAGQLAALDQLMALYPNDAILPLQKLACLRDMGRRAERLEMLASLCAKKESDPIFWQQHAQELAADPRESERASALLQRCMRYRPNEPGAYYILANIYSGERRFDDALELYHVATCLNDKDEQLAIVYFNATRRFKQAERALKLLHGRFERFGGRSGQPGRTLFMALAIIDRSVEAFAVLEEALQRRPDDGDLLLHAADANARFGRFERAEALLASAETRARRASWLRGRAGLEAYRGELKTALGLWQQVLESEPLAIDAHRAVAQLLSETASREQSADHVRRSAERFPHYLPLQQLLIECLRDEHAEEAEEALRRWIESNPADAWGHAELSSLLSRQKRHDEAIAAAEESVRCAPNNSYACSTRGRALLLAGRLEPAASALRQAIQLSVDNDDAISLLIAACDSTPQRREALSFIKGELVRQVTFGDGLLAYRHHASQLLPADEALVELRQALAERPDLWHAWSAVILQLVDGNRLDEALEVARQATERFPLLPRLWLDLSVVQQLLADFAGEIESLQQVLALSPTWGLPVRRLAAAHRRKGDLPAARSLLERAVAWEPLDASSHAALADILWRQGERDAAIESLSRAIRLAPAEERGWQLMLDWAAQAQRPQEAEKLARELTETRAGEARNWVNLARVLDEPALDERLACLDRAQALEPRLHDAHDLRAWLLAKAGRFDEARAACRPAIYGDRPPVELRAREVWVDAEQGDLRTAIERMSAILKDEPQYLWAWYRLAEWRREAEDQAGYLEAAEAICRLDPHEVTTHAQLGEALERAGQRERAKEAYRHALQLQPDHAFAGLSLFDLHLADNEIDAAQQVLDDLEARVQDDYVTARRVQLLCRQQRGQEALPAFRPLCTSSNADPWPKNAAFEALQVAGIAGNELLLQMAQADGVSPAVAEMWGERTARSRRLDTLEQGLLELAQRPPRERGWWRPNRSWQLPPLPLSAAFGSAVAGCLEAMPEVQPYEAIHRFIRRFGNLLKANDAAWAAAGRAYAVCGRHGEAAAWLADWAGRKEVRPWILSVLGLSLRAIGRDNEAGEVSQRAMEMPADHTRAMHRALLALDRAIAGEAAGDLLRQIDSRNLPDLFQALLRLAWAAEESRRRSAQDPLEAYRAARAQVEEATAAWPGLASHPVFRRAVCHTASRIAQNAPVLRSRMWAALKSARWAMLG